MNAPGRHNPARSLVVGLGVSGRAVCELLARRGVQVRATDLRPADAFGDSLEMLRSLGVGLRLGEHRQQDFSQADQIIVSPGVPLDMEPLRQAAEQGVEIVGELEWAWRQVNLPCVAVTGTNGKTTVTSLLGHILKRAGKRVFVGGNIGTPLSGWLLEREQRARQGEPAEGEETQILVLEVSSFQLDSASTFAPHVAVLLNISEDHLDRYADFSRYVASKASIFRRQQEDDYAVINGGDPLCRRIMDSIPSRVVTFGSGGESHHAVVAGGAMEIRLPGSGMERIDLRGCPLKGVHNVENLMAAGLSALVLGVRAAEVERALHQVEPLAHRIEWVGRRSGIDFYNDSKATNVAAVARAIESFDSPVILLMGGRDKGGSYHGLRSVMEGRVKRVFAFGEAARRIVGQVESWVPARACRDLDQAFAEALGTACAGDVVLLSPACSSFDQYQNYVQRGEHFRRLVSGLPNRPVAASLR